MTTYIHPDGTHVGITDTPGEIATWHTLADGPGDRQYIHPARAAAIHAAYLDSLGLWLDEETGCLVDTASRRVRGSSTAFKVLQREAEGWTDDEGWTDRTNRDERDQAVDRYVATLAPPQPEPQPGEVWEVTLDDGSKARALAESRGDGKVGIRWFTWAWFPDEFPDRRLLITADGEWVGGES